jgi:hypothetical protein
VTPPPNPTGLALLKQALDLPAQVLDLGCDLVRDLVGEPVKVAGGMLGDQVYWWQWRNRIRIANRAAEMMNKDGIARRIVPPSFLLPLLDAASNVDDPDLQEMWARLLASGVATDEHQHPMWVKILAQMSAEDAHVFHACCFAADRGGVGPVDERTTPTPVLRALPSPTIVRLDALGLVTPRAFVNFAHVLRVGDEGFDGLPTGLGVQFRAAVLPKPATDPQVAPNSRP